MEREFFNKGEDVWEYIASLGDSRSKFEGLLAETVFDNEQREKLDRASQVRFVAAIVEPWSGDVMYNLPVLLEMAEEVGWEIRIFRRDSYPELMEAYLNEGLYRSIPVFIFFDENFNEIGNWVERPAAATKVIEEEQLNLRRRLREENKVEWRQETVREILELTSE